MTARFDLNIMKRIPISERTNFEGRVQFLNAFNRANFFIALLSEEDSLPEHARVLSPWNPFGLTACAGTGRSASEARSADESVEPQEQETALLLTLPQGLDWRTQPFSHVGGPGSRPMRVPVMRRQQPEPRQADQRQAA